ncbi:MAG: hypothetical protein A3C07_04575 [Candidatus Sungbacteria bacterium RIFCSPHIGHO2_02_FULL_47_11]|uniref:Dehydrogenase n=1 Tax=Candidatus Sungbacteria bacterium RIFCSPHIGHO2_02_FULL_47_11 TaxID=1802270 RepID=A0A1G2KJ83_9BACT|nr:MAG: hypothetical protein A3C07_04575 [Candidatus Sungbacteria bacterium RIFCSPHIGHO2_02_FULL_47_11]
MMLSGKTALITGGSRGIGKAVASALAKEGAGLLLVSTSATGIESAKQDLAKDGAKVETMACDVSREQCVEDAVKLAKKVFGRIDILVNAAGIYGPIGRISDIDPGEWRKTLEVNLTGTFLMTRAVLSVMQEQRSGKIINFVGGGEGPYPRFSAYVASKGGVARFTETAAAEVKEFGIDINAIAPGAVNTAFLDELLATGSEKVGEETYQRSIQQKKDGGVPPEKAAALCVFLASEKSNGLSGKILSAVWDQYEKFPEHLDEIMESDALTYRRVKPQV